MPGSGSGETPHSVGSFREAMTRTALSAEQIDKRGPAAAIRHVHQVDAAQHLEQLAANMRHTSDTG
jgi:hypothetical protein